MNIGKRFHGSDSVKEDAPTERWFEDHAIVDLKQQRGSAADLAALFHHPARIIQTVDRPSQVSNCDSQVGSGAILRKAPGLPFVKTSHLEIIGALPAADAAE